MATSFSLRPLRTNDSIENEYTPCRRLSPITPDGEWRAEPSEQTLHRTSERVEQEQRKSFDQNVTEYRCPFGGCIGDRVSFKGIATLRNHLSRVHSISENTHEKREHRPHTADHSCSRSGSTILETNSEAGSSREDDTEKRVKRKRKNSSGSSVDLSICKLACPFYRRYPNLPQPSSSCAGSRWPTVHRLKEHLYRCHTKAEDQRVRLTAEHLRQLKTRERRGLSEEAKWHDMCNSLFSNSPLNVRPWLLQEIALSPRASLDFPATIDGTTDPWMAYLQQNLPLTIRAKLESQGANKWLGDKAFEQIEDTIRNSLDELLPIRGTLKHEGKKTQVGEKIARTDTRFVHWDDDFLVEGSEQGFFDPQALGAQLPQDQDQDREGFRASHWTVPRGPEQKKTLNAIPPSVSTSLGGGDERRCAFCTKSYRGLKTLQNHLIRNHIPVSGGTSPSNSKSEELASAGHDGPPFYNCALCEQQAFPDEHALAKHIVDQHSRFSISWSSAESKTLKRGQNYSNVHGSEGMLRRFVEEGNADAPWIFAGSADFPSILGESLDNSNMIMRIHHGGERHSSESTSTITSQQDSHLDSLFTRASECGQTEGSGVEVVDLGPAELHTSI